MPRQVYFIEAATGDKVTGIKIGWSRNAQTRLTSLQIGNPSTLRLLAVLSAGQSIETLLHRHFMATRIRGEWFEPSDELHDLIALCRDNPKQALKIIGSWPKPPRPKPKPRSAEPEDGSLEDFWRDIRPGYRGGRGRSVWLIGKTFGRLTVLERAGSDKHGASTWKCRCECGTEKVVQRGALIQGRVKSCGCLLEEYRHAQKAHLVEHAKAKVREPDIEDIFEGLDDPRPDWADEEDGPFIPNDDEDEDIPF